MNTAPYIDCGDLILRLPQESDIADRLKLGRSYEFVKMCGGSTEGILPFTENELRGWYESICKTPCAWVIELNGSCIGSVSLTVHKDDNKATYAIGIYDEALFGKGYGTKVTRVVLKYAFYTLLLHRVDLRVLEFNTRAIRCYEKCGFIREGILRDGACIDGEYYSDVMMSILEDEYIV
ncbi:MAG: GNAT family N-acetyltransferase [Oscillospiraceae bacterium]|nr:GNAT family N-acetyltransferase [Oscillospiraceae bacterium]